MTVVSTSIRIEEGWRQVPGHLCGLTGPLLIGSLLWPERPAWNVPAIIDALVAALPGTRSQIEQATRNGLDPGAFLAILHEISVIHRLPAVQRGKVVGARSGAPGERRIQVAIPTVEPRHAILVVRWLANGIRGETGPLVEPAAERSGQDLLTAAQQLVPSSYRGSVNSIRIARAAAEVGRSHRWLVDGHLLVGSGRHGRLFRSTITETTSALGTSLARSKSQTAALLTMAGLPSVRHHPVGSIDAAVHCANELGYPVVLKPNDLDGGVGVYAGLENEQQLREHFEAALQVSRNLLVEKHVDGQDYRLTVDDGRVVKAILRRPGGVTGDGRSSIAELVEQVRSRAPAARRGGSLLSLDDEALRMLSRAGMEPGSIPDAGRFVPLRMRANMSTGGSSHDAMADMHPDNAKLAVRAAATLRLDVAGIDLLIRDISVSWTTSGAAICEVNAQPQISTEFAPEVFRDLIRRLVPAPGDLRAIVVLDFGDGSADPERCTAAIARALGRNGEHVFWSGSDGLHLDGDLVGLPSEDVYASAMAATLDRQASAAVVSMPASLLASKGLPWPRIDGICVAGTDLTSRDDATLLQNCARLSREHLLGPMVVERALLPKARELLTGIVDLASFEMADGHPTTDWLEATDAH